MDADRHRARALAEQRHPRRVAAELADVLLHPAKRDLLIQQSVVAGERRPAGEETERAESIVERDHDDRTGRSEIRAVVDRRRATAVEKRATGEEDHHGKACADVRRPHVDRQAVLVDRDRYTLGQLLGTDRAGARSRLVPPSTRRLAASVASGASRPAETRRECRDRREAAASLPRERRLLRRGRRQRPCGSRRSARRRNSRRSCVRRRVHA